MSSIDIRTLREAAEKASKGKWVVFAKSTPTFFDAIHSLAALLNGTKGDQKTLYMIGANRLCTALTGTGPNSANNAEFIASFNPSTVLALLDEVEAKDKQIADLKGAFRIALSAAGIDLPAAAGKGE